MENVLPSYCAAKKAVRGPASQYDKNMAVVVYVVRGGGRGWMEACLGADLRIHSANKNTHTQSHICTVGRYRSVTVQQWGHP